VPGSRNRLSFILVETEAGVDPAVVVQRIEQRTGLRARLSRDFAQDGIGFIFQQYNLLPSLTAAENAAVPLIAAGLKRSKAIERASALLDRLNISQQADKYPRTMSGGQQQRVNPPPRWTQNRGVA